MARTVTSISVFLASPGDVDRERDIVARAIQDWNDINGRHRGVYFELLRHERSVSAGFGGDGQDVINSQINDEYDLLIALFWKRLGSSTPRSRSGTVEEYERALERVRKGDRLDLAFFFKDAPVNFRSEDLEQLSSVRSFEEEVQRAGALTKTFTNDDGLRFELTSLLSRIAHESVQHGGHPSGRKNRDSVGGTNGTALAAENPDNKASVDDVNEDDEPGLFDVLDDLTRHAMAGAEFLKRMTEKLTEMTEVTDAVNAEMAETTKLRPLEPGEMKPVISRVSASMNSYSDFLEEEFSTYAENTSLMVEDLSRMINISYDFLSDDNEKLISQVKTFRATILEMIAAMTGARAGFAGMQEFNPEPPAYDYRFQ